MVFGHFGDRIGRKSTLVSSLLLMGGSTVCIGLLPTYAMAGWIAPLALCVLRFGQGFGLGGEWGGAALLAVENAPPGRKAWFGMFPQLGAPVGFIAANGPYVGCANWVSTAATAGATSVVVNAQYGLVNAGGAAATATVIPANAVLVFTQYPEVLVKFNHGFHEYYQATATQTA